MEHRGKMLASVVLMSFLFPLLSATEEFWDPADPKCEEYRKTNGAFWDDLLPRAYQWIDNYNYQSRTDASFQYGRQDREFVEKGCREYETYKKTDYKCWSQEFLCAAAEVLQSTLDGTTLKINYKHKPWYHCFEKVGPHQANDRDQEISWISKMRWNDPRLLKWAKNDLEEVGKEMFERVFYYIEKNNIDSLKLVCDHYKSSTTMEFMRRECDSRNQSDSSMHCKVAIVFDRLAELIIDSNDIPWNMGSCRSVPRTREELSMLYLLQPKVYEIMDIGSEARNRTLCYRLRTMFKSLFDNTLNDKGDQIRGHFGKFGSIYDSMKSDCEATYKNDFEEMVCYLSETFSRMNLLVTELGRDYSNWQSSRAKSMKAVVLVWLLLTPKAYFYIEPTDLVRAQSAKELLKIMYKKLRNNEITSLQEISNLIPNEDQMGLKSSDECAPNFDKISRDMKCGFKIVLEHLAVFLDQYKSKDQKTKRLNLAIQHKTRLEQFQISSIKNEVENTKLELKSSLEGFVSEIKKFFEASIGNRFESLRNYHESLASFDLEIANADTTYINDKLKYFKDTAVQLSTQLEYDSSKMQQDLLIIKSIDAAFMWMKAIGSGISAVIGIIGGDFSGFQDTADRIDAAAKTTLEAVEGGAIKEQIEITMEKFRAITEGFKQNEKQLKDTKDLIDKLNDGDTSSEEFKKLQKDFLTCYNAYTPKVNEAQIAELDSAWSQVVDNLEDLADSMETKEAIIGVTKSFVKNHYFKIKLVVPKLVDTLTKRFEFQFDLMDSLKDAVRAHTALQGSKGLSQGFADLERQLAESELAQIALDQMALSTYILSQFHLLLLLAQFCNYVTYVNAGVESVKCTTALRTMETVHIDDAISYEPPSCDEASVDLKIPTGTSGSLNSINLKQFNSGEAVPFEIPNFDWLKLHGDMSESDRDKAFFVKQFEVYVLTNDKYQIKTNLRVTVTPSGSGPVYPISGQTKYELVPTSRTQYVFEYKENYRGNCRSEVNPYSVCSPGPKGICFKSRGEVENNLNAYPSVYSPWIIKLDEDIGNAPNPAPGTNVYLQAKLLLCRKTKDSNVRSGQGRKRVLHKFTKGRQMNDSNVVPCPQGKYFNQDTLLFAACSADSTPQRNNYYCELNQSDDGASE